MDMKCKAGVLLGSLLLMASLAQAQSSSPSIFQQCAAENNITLPAGGSGQQLTAEEHEAIHSCVSAARKQAFAACAAQVGFTPGQGQRLPASERSAVHQCMASKGFHGHHHHQQAQNSNESAT